jgi:hypothetical protein
MQFTEQTLSLTAVFVLLTGLSAILCGCAWIGRLADLGGVTAGSSSAQYPSDAGWSRLFV